MHVLNDETYNPNRLNIYMQENVILNEQPTNEINKHQQLCMINYK